MRVLFKKLPLRPHRDSFGFYSLICIKQAARYDLLQDPQRRFRIDCRGKALPGKLEALPKKTHTEDFLIFV